jgi:hypothetical protein
MFCCCSKPPPPDGACTHPCARAQGKQLLRQWCLSPVADLGVLADRHDTIEALMAAPDLAASVAATLRTVGAQRPFVCWGGAPFWAGACVSTAVENNTTDLIHTIPSPPSTMTRCPTFRGCWPACRRSRGAQRRRRSGSSTRASRSCCRCGGSFRRWRQGLRPPPLPQQQAAVAVEGISNTPFQHQQQRADGTLVVGRSRSEAAGRRELGCSLVVMKTTRRVDCLAGWGTTAEEVTAGSNGAAGPAQPAASGPSSGVAAAPARCGTVSRSPTRSSRPSREICRLVSAAACLVSVWAALLKSCVRYLHY